MYQKPKPDRGRFCLLSSANPSSLEPRYAEPSEAHEGRLLSIQLCVLKSYMDDDPVASLIELPAFSYP
jgi:hypothetical protein